MKSLRPLVAIRKECLACCLGSRKEVELCATTGCPIHPYRFGKRVKTKHSPLKAIKLKCRDCGEGTAKSVRGCEFDDCALFPLRFGENPNRKGIGPRNGVRKKNVS